MSYPVVRGMAVADQGEFWFDSSKDYYDILHVHRSADEATIKRAYRKLALKMHPDKVQGTEEEKKKAAEKFAEVGHGALLFPIVVGA